ncbi:septum site-determining protein MinC [Nitrosomonas sp. Nm51]|uniref:septum site-determining protein MinC n=1 Tax=Nitrosomonas sp. Nm51 TaxID=133720 RepID=UPI0008B5B3BF|nr:septum site-determining protein MinC [Nitrosomonas sp. Nm51]SER57553.1 septum site-determining protein MinC [Nitrosomonas sp. Nm51]
MLNSSSVLEFKSTTFFTPTLVLNSNDIAAIELSLQEKINLAPDFFKHSPLVIDVRELNRSELDFSVTEIVETLRRIGLFPIGLRGGTEQQNSQAQKLSIPVDAGRDHDNSGVAHQSRGAGDVAAASMETPAADETDAESEAVAITSTNAGLSDQSAAPAVPVRSMVVTQPVRSGQRIYAQGDLVVMSQVSAGAEIMAEGNIHVYNTLRGRALAGVQGNTSARIFCLDLQAELVSIAGDYKTSEHITKEMQKKPVQIYLQDHALIINEIA